MSAQIAQRFAVIDRRSNGSHRVSLVYKLHPTLTLTPSPSPPAVSPPLSPLSKLPAPPPPHSEFSASSSPPAHPNPRGGRGRKRASDGGAGGGEGVGGVRHPTGARHRHGGRPAGRAGGHRCGPRRGLVILAVWFRSGNGASAKPPSRPYTRRR
jgi:hypothetical protein